MNDHCVYRVGDHLFALDISPELLSEKELMNYAPFRAVRCREGEELLFSLTAVTGDDMPADAGDEIASFTDENGRMALLASPAGGLTVRLTTPAGKDCCLMDVDPAYRRATALIGGTTAERRYALDTSLMLLYAFASADRDTLLIHASAVESDGRGYLFLGKSGTGKSTHSRLWLRHIAGTHLLNDDNPVVRIADGQFRVYGTPWSGKTPCYLDRSLPVGAIIRLHQAPDNHIRKLNTIRAYASLLPSCSYMKWNPAMAEAVHSTVSLIAGSVPVFDLDCRPYTEAALLCKDAVGKTTKE